MTTTRLLRALETQEIETPAFVFDEAQLIQDAGLARDSHRTIGRAEYACGAGKNS
jgi:hypothetical protein